MTNTGSQDASSISFDIVGLMGQPSKIKSIKKAQLITIKSQNAVDVTDKIKYDGNSKIDVDLKGFDAAEL